MALFSVFNEHHFHFDAKPPRSFFDTHIDGKTCKRKLSGIETKSARQTTTENCTWRIYVSGISRAKNTVSVRLDRFFYIRIDLRYSRCNFIYWMLFTYGNIIHLFYLFSVRYQPSSNAETHEPGDHNNGVYKWYCPRRNKQLNSHVLVRLRLSGIPIR